MPPNILCTKNDIPHFYDICGKMNNLYLTLRKKIRDITQNNLQKYQNYNAWGTVADFRRPKRNDNEM